MIYTIYTLSNTENGNCFYVGITEKSLKDRKYSHDLCVRSGNDIPVYNFIRENKILSVIEAIDYINTDDKDEALKLEKHWIEQFRQWGFTLLNYVNNISFKQKRIEIFNYKKSLGIKGNRCTININTEDYDIVKDASKKFNMSMAAFTVYAANKLPLIEDLLLRLLQDNSAETQSKLRNEGLKLLKM